MSAGQRVFYGILLLLISPMFALVHALRSNDRLYIRWILVLFATVYASTFDIEGIGDGSRHWQKVYDYYVGLPFGQFIADIGDILLFAHNENLKGDLYVHFLSYFVGQILGIPGAFFIIAGFIYGYFFAGSMMKVFHYFPSLTKHFPFFIIALYFITILNLQSMNTVRTWTGFWVLFYGVIQYHDTRRWKYLFLVLSAPFFHIGYFVMALPVWAVVFLPLKRYWIMVVYIASFFVSFVSPQSVVNQLQQLERGEEKVRGYYVEEKASVADRIQRQSKNRWYKIYWKSGIVEWAVVGVAVIFLLNGDYLRRMDSLEGLLFSAGLTSKVLSNATWFLYALSNRSGVIANLFILAAITLYWQRHYASGEALSLPPWLRPLLYMAILFIVPVFVFYLSNTLEYLSAYILFFPEVAWFSEELRMTIRELIGKLLGI
jgi:hypothetical protein